MEDLQAYVGLVHRSSQVVDVRRLRWSVRLATLGITLVLACVACTDKPPGKLDGSNAPPSLSAPSISASQDLAAAGQNALDAYRGMWKAYQEALAVPDPAYPDLTRYATGKALDTLTKGLQSIKDQGLKGAGSITAYPKITAIAPAAAPTDIEITDCLDTTASRIVRASPGPAYSDSPGGHRRTLATVKRQSDGGWKVDSFGVQAVGTC